MLLRALRWIFDTLGMRFLPCFSENSLYHLAISEWYIYLCNILQSVSFSSHNCCTNQSGFSLRGISGKVLFPSFSSPDHITSICQGICLKVTHFNQLYTHTTGKVFESSVKKTQKINCDINSSIPDIHVTKSTYNPVCWLI